LNKSFVRKRVQAYINECLQGSGSDLQPTDVDDMNFDSLKEQAEKLNIFDDGPSKAIQGRLINKKRKVIGAVDR